MTKSNAARWLAIQTCKQSNTWIQNFVCYLLFIYVCLSVYPSVCLSVFYICLYICFHISLYTIPHNIIYSYIFTYFYDFSCCFYTCIHISLLSIHLSKATIWSGLKGLKWLVKIFPNAYRPLPSPTETPRFREIKSIGDL